MAIERTFGMVKPDAVRKNIIGEVLTYIEGSRLKIRALHMGKLSRVEAEWLYSQHAGKPHFEPLVEFMVSGPVVMMVIEGEDAIKRYRAVMGATDSAKAEEGTIRYQFGNTQVIRENCVHGSEDATAAERELDYFFSGFERSEGT